jgi:hypothetical protein
MVFKLRVVHPGSRIRFLAIYPSRIPDPDPRFRGQKCTGSRIRIRNTNTYVLYPPVAGSRKLYGGDLESAVSVMRTVASRIRALPEAFHKKEAYIQVP